MSVESTPPSRSHAGPRLLAFMAWRMLASSRVAFVLMVLAVAAGTGFQIPNTANLTGFRRELLEEGLTRGVGDVRVEPRDGARFGDAGPVVSRLRELAGVRAAVPMLVFPGSVGRRGGFVGTAIYGIDPDAPPMYHLTAGAPLHGTSDPIEVLLGTALARRLGVVPGDEIQLRAIVSMPGTALDDEALSAVTATVRGLVAGSTGAYRSAFVDRAFLSDEAGLPNGASAIVVHLDDHEAATAVAARIAAGMPDLSAIGWREDDVYFINFLRANATIHAVSYAMVIAAVAVPLWALLYIHALGRRREIAILVALGFGRFELFAIFLLQSVVVALIGCALGALIGYALVLYFQYRPVFEWEGLVARPLISVGTFVLPALAIIITAVVAGSYPAWRAARVDPARALRSID